MHKTLLSNTIAKKQLDPNKLFQDIHNMTLADNNRMISYTILWKQTRVR